MKKNLKKSNYHVISIFYGNNKFFNDCKSRGTKGTRNTEGGSTCC